jgi:hypothetical protein
LAVHIAQTLQANSSLSKIGVACWSQRLFPEQLSKPVTFDNDVLSRVEDCKIDWGKSKLAVAAHLGLRSILPLQGKLRGAMAA